MSEIDWMQRGPLGVMVHYIKGIMPRDDEPNDDWNTVVVRVDFTDNPGAWSIR